MPDGTNDRKAGRMASRIGKNISVSIFGQSHSAGIGCVVEAYLPERRLISMSCRRFFRVERQAACRGRLPAKKPIFLNFWAAWSMASRAARRLRPYSQYEYKKLRLRRAAPRAATRPCRLRGEYEIPRRARRFGRRPFFRSPYRSFVHRGRHCDSVAAR